MNTASPTVDGPRLLRHRLPLRISRRRARRLCRARPQGTAVVRRNGPTARLARSKICAVSTERDLARPNLLLALLMLHMAASLSHHIHNGHYLDEYPALPRGVPPGMAATGAYVAWIFTTVVGLAGCYWGCNGKRLLVFGAMGLVAAYARLPCTAAM